MDTRFEMKNIIFLGSRDFGQKNDSKKLMQACLDRLGLDTANFKHINFEDLLFKVSKNERSITVPKDGFDLKDSDLVIALNWYPHDKRRLRDLAFTISLYLDEHGISFWNSEMRMQRSTTKLSTAWLLSQSNIDVPETFFSLSNQILFSIYEGGSKIVKDIAASRGKNNYLISDSVELKSILDKKPEATFMLQEFIPNDYDIRLVCFGGEPSLAFKRQRLSSDTHLNNTSQGGTASLMELNELPEAVIETAKQICLLMGRELAGIDFLVANSGPKRYICLEVNAIPQLTSGSFIDQKFDGLSKSIAEWLERRSL
jgi:glutathione synthase/RimK-type ligase-like ATP-grasp enzyme